MYKIWYCQLHESKKGCKQYFSYIPSMIKYVTFEDFVFDDSLEIIKIIMLYY